MANDAHKNLTGVDLHECKGASTAAINTVRVSDGAGSGTWQKIGPSQTDGTLQAGKVLVGYQNASSSSQIDFVHGTTYNGTALVFDNTYDTYELEISGLVTSVDDVYMFFRVGTGGGPTYQTSAYSGGLLETFGNTLTTASTEIRLTRTNGAGVGLGNASGEHLSGSIKIFQPTSTSMFKAITTNLYYARADNSQTGVVGGASWTGTTAITAIRVAPSSGNIASGSFRLYGMRKT